MRYLAIDISSLFTLVHGGRDGVLAGMFGGISGGVGERHDKAKPMARLLVLAIYKLKKEDTTSLYAGATIRSHM